jgi:hypothetical protein
MQQLKVNKEDAIDSIMMGTLRSQNIVKRVHVY